MANGWTIESLKEHFEKLIATQQVHFENIQAEKDKALTAALIAVKEENRKTEVAAEKRFELLNELRSGVATKDQLQALEKMVDDLKTSRDKGDGKGDVLAKFGGWIAAAILAILGYLLRNK